jgi:uncharacterized phage protein gp47/JayE
VAYDMPSLDALSQRARRLFAEAIPGAVVDVWPNTFAVIAKVLAAIGFEVHLRLAWLSRQLFASTADDVWLERHGFELGLTRIPAKRATGRGAVAATAGIVIPAGMAFRRSDGVLFRTRTSAIAAGALTTVNLEAVDPGALGNSVAEEVLRLVDVGLVEGLGEEMTIAASGLGGGADIEPIETFRERILARKRNPPQGGSATDWIAWTREADAAITRVFVSTFVNDTRAVWVAFLRSDRANGIPNDADVAAVQAYISDPIRRPVTARVTAAAPIPQPVNIVISGLAPDSTTVRAAIGEELAAMFAERTAPTLPGMPFVLSRSWIAEAVSRAVGEVRHVLAAPAGDLIFSTPGHMPVPGSISFS